MIMNPSENEKLLSLFSLEEMRQLDQKLRNTTPECPILECEIEWNKAGKTKFSWIICRALWTQDEKKEYSGAIGKIIDIQEEKHELERLQKLASLDPLTNLLNAVSAEKKMKKILETHPENEYAPIILDLDYFKVVNSERGHLFGDRVLKYLADHLQQNIRQEDLAARIGGDEFLLFVRCEEDVEHVVKQIYATITEEYDGFQLSISMGIAKTTSVGHRYEKLFHCADLALFDAKRKERGCYIFYDEEQCAADVPTAISPIDFSENEAER